MIDRARPTPESSSATTRRLVAAAILCFVIVAHVLPTRAGDSYIMSALFDVAHVVGFAALSALAAAYVLRDAAQRGRSRIVLLSVTGAIVLGLAALAEAVQLASSRDANVGDIVRDACGIAAGLLVAAGLHAPRFRSAMLLGLAGLLGAAGLERPVGTLVAYAVARHGTDPTFGFDLPYQARLLVPRDASLTIEEAPLRWPHGGRVLRVVPNANAAVAGFTYHGLPSTWSGFTRLSFTIAAESPEPVDLLLRIEGPRVDRHRRRRSRIRVAVTSTPSEVSVPLATVAAVSSPEAFDYENVYGVSILATGGIKPTFIIDGFRLE